MSRSTASRIASLALIAPLVLLACDRNLAPLDPAEQPRPPDLGRIFPEGEREPERNAGPPVLPPPPEERAMAADPGADAPPIRGEVRLAPDGGSSGAAGAVLFVIARRGEGGPPLAVERIADPVFPLAFSIGPEDRMIASMPFAGPLQLSARLDADGDAMTRQPGDLQGAAASPAQPGDTGVAIVLDEVL